MTLAFIREHEAAGNVADTFADIKTTMRISTVNLIWRHLATNPPALEYAWARARPLYDSPNLERSVARFGQALDDALPVLPRLPLYYLRLASPTSRRWQLPSIPTTEATRTT